MKLICLNLYGGRQGKLLMDYLLEQATTTDIFCFQEVFDSTSKILEYEKARIHLFEELKKSLPNFQAFFAPAYSGWVDMQKVDFEVTEGQAIFVRKDLKVLETGAIYIYGQQDTKIAEDFTNEPKNMQYARIEIVGGEILVANAHGMWHTPEKNDSPERLEQSRKIGDFLNNYGLPKILCGDFNLLPQTKSIKMLEKNMRNLIKDFKITNTRNQVSWEKYQNVQYFADYAFVSPKIKVKSFIVPYNEVSDHLPLVLDFEIERLKD